MGHFMLMWIDWPALLQVLGSVKTVLDQWEITPFILGFVLIAVVASFVRKFGGGDK